jgi:hypothetical protein
MPIYRYTRTGENLDVSRPELAEEVFLGLRQA